MKRVLEAVVTLIALVLFTFLLFRALPGSPFDDETPLHPSVRAAMEKTWTLHGPWPAQLASYAAGLARGDLGVSQVDRRPVIEILTQGLRATLVLNLLAVAMVGLLGFALALLMAGPGGEGARHLSLALVALPNLFLGPLLIWIFALQLDWLPVAFLDGPLHYVLPVLTLSLRPAAALARILARALDEARVADYMRTAKAKGLSRAAALVRHALRNSLIPVLGYSGPVAVGLLSGSFIVEVLFAVHGVGAAFVEAVSNRDLPVILGLALFYGVLLILVSFALDIAMKFADPRVKDGA